jgi:glutathione peroxidase
MTNVYAFSAPSLEGPLVALKNFEGKVLLIVNTASQCGHTHQYEGLEKLQQEFQGLGFSVLAFPCNQFGGQEPGDAAEIAQTCRVRYGATFPVFQKIKVNGEDAHPLYRHLTGAHPGIAEGRIGWNFTKFLIGKKGEVLARFEPKDQPKDLREAIQNALKA